MLTMAFFAAAALLVFLAAGKGWAFHEGGVGACEGCHTMHNSITYGTSPGFKPNQYSPDGGVQGWTGIGSGAMAVVNPKGSVGSTPDPNLLRGTDGSSTCLNCHEGVGLTQPDGFYISTPLSQLNTAGAYPKQLTPGGDFGWLNKTYTWNTGTPYTDPGYMHGHYITAEDFDYTYENSGDTWTTAPGGGQYPYPASDLSCISCHDPHGTYRRTSGGAITNSPVAPIIASGSYETSPTPLAGQAVGVYRLLGGVNYVPPGGINYQFHYAPMAAIAPTVYNRSETKTSQTVVAYGNGTSAWCRNCHPDMHTGAGTDPFTDIDNVMGVAENFPQYANPYHEQINSQNVTYHPYNELGPVIASNYVSYIETGNYGGTSNAYWSLAPFEINTTSYSNLQLVVKNSESGLYPSPASTDKVSCLTCHRAHASGWDYIMRFKYNGNGKNGINDGNYGFSETMTDSSGGVSVYPDISTDISNSMGRTWEETQQAYYGWPASDFAPNETVICNKCHIGQAEPTGPPTNNNY